MDDPWFTYFKGRGKMQISPRNGKGWIATIVFVVLVSAPSLLLAPFLERSLWLLAPFFLLLGLIVFAFVRFAIARSERIDLTMTARELEEFREWKRRGKR